MKKTISILKKEFANNLTAAITALQDPSQAAILTAAWSTTAMDINRFKSRGIRCIIESFS